MNISIPIYRDYRWFVKSQSFYSCWVSIEMKRVSDLFIGGLETTTHENVEVQTFPSILLFCLQNSGDCTFMLYIERKVTQSNQFIIIFINRYYFLLRSCLGNSFGLVLTMKYLT